MLSRLCSSGTWAVIDRGCIILELSPSLEVLFRKLTWHLELGHFLPYSSRRSCCLLCNFYLIILCVVCWLHLQHNQVPQNLSWLRVYEQIDSFRVSITCLPLHPDYLALELSLISSIDRWQWLQSAITTVVVVLHVWHAMIGSRVITSVWNYILEFVRSWRLLNV